MRVAAPKDLSEFAACVGRAARSPKTKKFQGDRAFIASVYKNRGAALKSMGQGDFAAALIEAHRKGHLTLTRADLVGAMDAKLVNDSEIKVGRDVMTFVAL